MIVMRILLLFIVFLQMGCASSDERVKARIDAVLTPLESLLASDPSGLSAQNHLNGEWLPSSVFQPYFYEVPETLYEASPGRDERVRKIEQWMSPYEQSLIKVLQACQSNPEPPQAVMVYLLFSAPTPELREALLSVARNPRSLTHRAADAYDMIFMLDMGDPVLMNEVIGLIHESGEKTNRAEIGRDLMGRVERWARPEMMGIYLGLLNAPYDSGHYSSPRDKLRLTTGYQRAILGLKAFGELDDAVIALIKKRLSEVPLDEDPNLHRFSRDALLIAEGKLRPEPVVNFKGQLLGVSKEKYPAWLAAHPDKASGGKEQNNKFQIRVEDGGVRDSSRSSSDSSLMHEVSKRGAVWVVLGAGGVMAIALCWYLMRKRAKN